MSQISALTLIVAMSIPGAPAPAGGTRQAPALGTMSGTAIGSAHEPLANIVVRLRSVQTGKVTATTDADAAGRFSFAGLNPDTYVIELLNTAGQIVGTSPAISVAAGAVITGVTVTSPVAAARVAGAFLSPTMWGVVAAAAASAAIVGVMMPTTSKEASPSR